MKIEIKDGNANVYTPYNSDFVKKIKLIGGAKWDGKEKCWIVPETMIEAVRIIMNEVYGYSDTEENETVTLKVVFNSIASEFCSDVILFGKVMAHATGRDSGARVGLDVAYISGGATSGGSVKNWKSVVESGSVAILSNVNKKIYEREDIRYDINVEVLEKKTNRQQLLDEKERLLKRISEINKILQEE